MGSAFGARRRGAYRHKHKRDPRNMAINWRDALETFANRQTREALAESVIIGSSTPGLGAVVKLISREEWERDGAPKAPADVLETMAHAFRLPWAVPFVMFEGNNISAGSLAFGEGGTL